MTKKGKNPISLRLTDDVAEKFRNYSQNHAKSQSEFIEILLKRFDDTQHFFSIENKETINFQEIWIFMNYYNQFEQDAEKRYKSMKKYKIHGSYVYWYPNRLLWMDCKYYSEFLTKEFKIQTQIQNLKYGYWFGVLWDESENQYLLVETFVLIEEQENNSSSEKLNVRRCKYYSKIEDVIIQIKNFTNSQELINFEQFIAPTASKEELEDYWL